MFFTCALQAFLCRLARTHTHTQKYKKANQPPGGSAPTNDGLVESKLRKKKKQPSHDTRFHAGVFVKNSVHILSFRICIYHPTAHPEKNLKWWENPWDGGPRPAV